MLRGAHGDRRWIHPGALLWTHRVLCQ